MIILILLSFFTIFYIWLVYALIISSKTPKYNKNFRQPVSVIIPCYNENPVYLKKCVDSIVNCNGEKQIILVNNNSNNPETIQVLNELKSNKKILIINEQRQGKRFAHSTGLKLAKHEIIVFVDSDTILSKNALIELVIPFQDNIVGGVTGQIRLANKTKNLVTRSLDSMFWTSSNIFRRSGAVIGFMQVMPGALSSYRKSDLLKLEPNYLSQKFLGKRCSISDDRYLTIRVQTRLGKKIRFTENAIAYTYMPETIMGFWKTVERWKRGMLREIILLWKEPIKNNKWLFFDTQFNFLMFNIVMITRISLIFNLIFNFSLNILFMTIFWLFIMNFFWGAYMIVHNPREFKYKIVYSVLNEFFWVFSYFQALINIRKQSNWVTR